jgi:hypothetical protein
VWDLSPFVLLWLGDRFSSRWSPQARVALYWLMPVVSFGTVAYYLADFFSPPHAQAAYPYVIAPPVAWVLIALVLGGAALLPRKTI